MAIRREDLAPSREGGRDAVVYKFPTARVRGAETRRRRMEVRRRRTALVAAGLVMIALFLLATGPSGSAPASAPGAPKAVTVHAGDTLWDLAERYAPQGVDPRAYVDVVSELNDLENGLVAGMRIRLPK